MAVAAPDLLEEIRDLKRIRRAVVLCHNYQMGEVQKAADRIGDSLELARWAAQTEAEVICFCGVHFMAETAALLNPDKITLLPDPAAGCGLAEMITPEDVRRLRAAHPEAAVVCYVNTSASVKAESDICCTSANAAKVVNSLPNQKIIFIPDKNLGRWVAGQTDKEIVLWEGFCPVHQQIRREDVLAVKAAHPGALFLAHPECEPEVLALADEVLSTGGMTRFVADSPRREFIVATEAGILHRLRRNHPDKRFYAVTPAGQCCEGALCEHMKRITPQKLRDALRDLKPRVEVPEEIAGRARLALQRMLEVS